MERIELYQFPFSHDNVKARWAVDWKGIPVADLTDRIPTIRTWHAGRR